MLIDELREKLKSVEPDLKTINLFWENNKLEDKYNTLNQTINSEEFWKHPNQINLSKEFQNIKELREDYSTINNSFKDLCELIELFGEDENELNKVKGEIHQLCRKISKFKIELLLNKEEDKYNCFLSINSGAGGTESQDWANILLRMYLRFCEREGFKVDVLDYQDGEEAGIKSAVLFIRGKNAFGLLKAENGIHRLVRISPFDANKKRHTSFAAITATPEIADAKIEIKDEDLRVDTYRAGGKGGQHVNKTDSAVRITHIPSGIVVQCQNERSQLQNKQTAMKMLMAKLVEVQEQEKKTKESSVERKKIEWGSQIRSYVLHPYKMVKDHRTDLESPQPDLVLDGDIMPFIEKYLISANG
ncbi:TPA: peptide chain release factor 2 [Candidatus Dependentiae bacterium]|nr:MAG: Peptide chain release factor 2 [candidate division TM6 bacterium GW2011_GWE2_31_21]KKP53026.1 MAG: Peptide chain release factor 2 [candidate division TM6 bacterium GW2011_GWF2_33_332]HBS48094.1 peptide chain release factor 2 [Candidatus Dependentiae bacterium]HBZ73511.1 peptide chain release factor 2 [Candidatus Dependentiae bacterium]